MRINRLGWTVFGIIFCSSVSADVSGPLDADSISKRLAPEVILKIEGAVVEEAAIVDVGKSIYDKICSACHNDGLAGAPKLKDKAEWQKRLSVGIETLIKHAISGYKVMPPKGGCSTCSDDDIKKSVEYMVEKSK